MGFKHRDKSLQGDEIMTWSRFTKKYPMRFLYSSVTYTHAHQLHTQTHTNDTAVTYQDYLSDERALSGAKMDFQLSAESVLSICAPY